MHETIGKLDQEKYPDAIFLIPKFKGNLSFQQSPKAKTLKGRYNLIVFISLQNIPLCY